MQPVEAGGGIFYPRTNHLFHQRVGVLMFPGTSGTSFVKVGGDIFLLLPLELGDVTFFSERLLFFL